MRKTKREVGRFGKRDKRPLVIKKKNLESVGGGESEKGKGGGRGNKRGGEVGKPSPRRAPPGGPEEKRNGTRRFPRSPIHEKKEESRRTKKKRKR